MAFAERQEPELRIHQNCLARALEHVSASHGEAGPGTGQEAIKAQKARPLVSVRSEADRAKIDPLSSNVGP